jgi:hypothetical protein
VDDGPVRPRERGDDEANPGEQLTEDSNTELVASTVCTTPTTTSERSPRLIDSDSEDL